MVDGEFMVVGVGPPWRRQACRPLRESSLRQWDGLRRLLHLSPDHDSRLVEYCRGRSHSVRRRKGPSGAKHSSC